MRYSVPFKFIIGVAIPYSSFSNDNTTTITMVITIVVVVAATATAVVVVMCLTMCHQTVSGLNLFLHNYTSLLINGVPFKIVAMELYAIDPVFVLPFYNFCKAQCLKVNKCLLHFAWIMVISINLLPLTPSVFKKKNSRC